MSISMAQYARYIKNGKSDISVSFFIVDIELSAACQAIPRYVYSQVRWRNILVIDGGICGARYVQCTL